MMRVRWVEPLVVLQVQTLPSWLGVRVLLQPAEVSADALGWHGHTFTTAQNAGLVHSAELPFRGIPTAQDEAFFRAIASLASSSIVLMQQHLAVAVSDTLPLPFDLQVCRRLPSHR
jgi:hypothetical protein